MNKAITGSLVGVALIGGAIAVATSGGSSDVISVPAGYCARAPADGGHCINHEGIELGGQTYSTGRLAVGQCDIFVCPQQP